MLTFPDMFIGINLSMDLSIILCHGILRSSARMRIEAREALDMGINDVGVVLCTFTVQ